MTIICACAVCRLDIAEGEDMADHRIYDRIDGELDYIELAHLACGKTENARIGSKVWDYDETPEDADMGEY